MENLKMTSQQFVDFMADLKGHQFVNIMALTEPSMTCDNPFKGRVKKFTITPMSVNYDYEKAVNRRLVAEGKEPTFKVGKLPWGQWCNGLKNKVIQHKGKFYLRTYCVRKQHPRSYYLLDGHLASSEEYNAFAPYLEKSDKESAKQSACGLEQEFQVKPRNYKFESIVAISIKHTRIFIED